MPTISIVSFGKVQFAETKKAQLPGHMRDPEAGREKKRGTGPREVQREELKSGLLAILESLRELYVRSVGTMARSGANNRLFRGHLARKRNKINYWVVWSIASG